jgi:hypothetical protein
MERIDKKKEPLEEIQPPGNGVSTREIRKMEENHLQND